MYGYMNIYIYIYYTCGRLHLLYTSAKGQNFIYHTSMVEVLTKWTNTKHLWIFVGAHVYFLSSLHTNNILSTSKI